MEVQITKNMGKKKGKLLLKIEEISGGKAHTNTQKFIRKVASFKNSLVT